ncbi:MAG: hypothetical protein PF447_09585 [Spirochaetaceae bacterium]|jgi:hypothetical protein|nr:hypothetical protein [Spirochaetaceae bacterium]
MLKLNLILAIVIFVLQGLTAQQYWKDFFFFNDPQGFDNPPYMSMELSLDEAQSIGSYTEVLFGQWGMEEALSYVHNDPEYLYQFHYDEQGKPQLRLSFYVDDFMALSPLEELFFYYDDRGLYGVSLYEYSLFDPNIKTRQLTKLLEDGRLKYFNDFDLSRKQDVLNKLKAYEREILESLPPMDSLLLGFLEE